MITHVAIIHKGTLYSLPKPNRHHNVIRLIYACTGHPVYGQTEGFLDRHGSFIGRKTAANIVADTKQPLRFEKLVSPPNLYSEDLW